MKIKLDKERIDELFEASDHQADVLVGLYRMVYPNWDNIAKIGRWPIINRKTTEYIVGKFVTFDRLHHPKVLSGGLWLYSGFSCSEGKAEDLDDFEAIPAPAILKKAEVEL